MTCVAVCLLNGNTKTQKKNQHTISAMESNSTLVIKNRKYVKNLKMARATSLLEKPPEEGNSEKKLFKNHSSLDDSPLVESLRDKIYSLEHDLSREKTVKEAAVNKLYKMMKTESEANREWRLSVRSKISNNSVESDEKRLTEKRRKSADTLMTNHGKNDENGNRRSSFDALEKNKRNPSKSLKIIEHKYIKLKEAFMDMEENYKAQIESLEMKVHDLELQLEVKNENRIRAVSVLKKVESKTSSSSVQSYQF